MSRQFNSTALLMATHNPGKVAEMNKLLPASITVQSAADIGLPDIEETGATFAENARLKALHAARFANMPALADDSGFSIDALNGDPGVYSKRFAEQAGGYPLAFQQLHGRLGNADRMARFVCVLCLAWPDGHTETVRGEVTGQFIYPPKGESGFGYDLVFVPDGYDISFAQMPQEQKNALSHRSRAVSALINQCFHQS